MTTDRFPLTTTPFTYVIDYGGWDGHMAKVDGFVEEVAQAPPHLLHVAHDVPIPNTCGTVIWRAGGEAWRMSVAQVRERAGTIADMVQRMHALGVETMIPYICNQTVAGEPDRRLGIWDFYDHWDEYAELGIGPRPQADPADWLARERNGRPHFNYEMRHPAFVPLGMFRYAPCANNPHYNAYQRMVVVEIAKVGFDGVFVDNCILNCYCKHCQEKFRDYLAAKYPPEALAGRFGIADPGAIELAWRGSRLEWVKGEPTFKEFLAETWSEQGLIEWLGTADLEEARLEEWGNGLLWGRAHDYQKWMERRYAPRELEKMFGVSELSQWGLRTPQERALWAETKLFWAESIRDNLAFIKQVGSEVRGDFYVLPNWGSMQSFDAAEFREEIGHDVEAWAPAMDSMMYEEDGEAGRVAHGFYLDHLMQQKLALALGVRGTVMASRGREGTDELAHAQAVAAGGGAYIQHSVCQPQTGSRYRAFIDDNADLLEGLRSYAEIAMAGCMRELRMENHAHLRQVYQICRYLADQHVLFDLIVEKQINPEVLRDYRVLILPETHYLTDSEAEAAAGFARAGGLLVLTGESGCCDDAGQPRATPAFAPLLEGARRREEVRVSRDGHCLHAAGVGAWIGADNISREDTLDYAMYSMPSLNVPTGRSADAVFELDRMIGVDRYYDAARLVPSIERRIGHRVRLAEGRGAAGAVFHAYRKQGTIVLHAVNYNVPAVEDPRGQAAFPIERLRVTLPLPEGFEVSRVSLREVGGEERPVRHRVSGGLLRFTIPRLYIHQVAIIR